MYPKSVQKYRKYTEETWDDEGWVYSLTDIGHIYIGRVREIAAQCVGGHYSDVVVDPEGCVIFVEETGVLPCRVVVWTFIHHLRAGGERETEILCHYMVRGDGVCV